jgi:DNA processing protein
MDYASIDAKQIPGLADLKKPPKTLYAVGQWNQNLFSNCVAVVGSRRMTSYGRQVVEQIVPQLVMQGKTIVSGFMYGVDQYAHQVCLEHGGKTIAVLGWGIDQKLKGADKTLAGQIIAHGGILLSEWEHQTATLWTFPLRNRLIVGLSQEVIVVEAAAKSGSLITAEIAFKMKRKLWAVPGPITSIMSEGTNALIAKGKATMWTASNTSSTSPVVSHPLLKILKDEPLSPNEIARKTKQSVAQIGAELTMLALCGQVIERDGKYSLQ